MLTEPDDDDDDGLEASKRLGLGTRILIEILVKCTYVDRRLPPRLN